MKPKPLSERIIGAALPWVIVLALPVLLACAAAWEYYVCGQQAEVYAQQGVTISRWQVFIGVKPSPALQKGR